MTLQKFNEIEKILCDKIRETDIIRHTLTDYQFKNYKKFREGYLTALIEFRRILESDLVESE